MNALETTAEEEGKMVKGGLLMGKGWEFYLWGDNDLYVRG